MRHTFITRLAENSNVNEETIRQLAGHVSARMPARYADILRPGRRAAIATFDTFTEEPMQPRSGRDAQLTMQLLLHPRPLTMPSE